MSAIDELRCELERLLLENQALINSGKKEFELITPSEVFEEEKYSPFPTLIKNGVENHIIHTLSDEIPSSVSPQLLRECDLPNNDPVGQFHLTRLNDVLRGCGVPAISRGLDPIQMLSACTEAIVHLSERNRDLLLAVPHRGVLTVARQPVHVVDNRVSEKPTIPPELIRVKRELFQQKTELANQSTQISHLEHVLRQKDSEIDSLRLQLRTRLADEDRRAALAVSTVREQNMGSKAVIVLDHYQREIETLQLENASLKNFQKEAKRDEQFLAQKLVHLKECSVELETVNRLVEKVVGGTLEDKIRVLLETSRPLERSSLGEKICQIFKIKSQQDIVPILTRVDSKMTEFEIFYNSLCCVLGLGSRVPFAQCLDHLSKCNLV